MRKRILSFCIDLSPVFLVVAITTSLIGCKAQSETTSTSAANQRSVLQKQQEWDDYQRAYRCQRAPFIEQRRNEMLLAGQRLPALIVEGCKGLPNRTIDVSSTAFILNARIDQLKSLELTSRQLAERITADILRIEATGTRDLEHVDCFTGIACIFTGPLAGLNNIDHFTNLLQQRAGEVNEDMGAPDSDPEKGPRPLSVGIP